MHISMGSETGHPPEQGGGVRAAGEGDDDAVPGIEGGLCMEEDLQPVEKVHEIGLDSGGDGTRTHDLAVMSRSL